MQEIELRFGSLKDLIQFKLQSEVKELRIDTNEKSLTGKFPECEVLTAVKFYKAITFEHPQVALAEGLKSDLYLM